MRPKRGPVLASAVGSDELDVQGLVGLEGYGLRAVNLILGAVQGTHASLPDLLLQVPDLKQRIDVAGIPLVLHIDAPPVSIRDSLGPGPARPLARPVGGRWRRRGRRRGGDSPGRGLG